MVTKYANNLKSFVKILPRWQTKREHLLYLFFGWGWEKNQDNLWKVVMKTNPYSINKSTWFSCVDLKSREEITIHVDRSSRPIQIHVIVSRHHQSLVVKQQSWINTKLTRRKIFCVHRFFSMRLTNGSTNWKRNSAGIQSTTMRLGCVMYWAN